LVIGHRDNGHSHHTDGYIFGRQEYEALLKGKVAIELSAQSELIPTLEKLKSAASEGERDMPIEVMSGTLHRGFAKM
jgi:hypothetical protein